ARHRRILGRLHDDVTRCAILTERGNDQVRVHCNAPARLPKQQTPKRVIGTQRLHALVHRLARRCRHSTHADVASPASGMTTDHREHPAGTHSCQGTLSRTQARPGDRHQEPASVHEVSVVVILLVVILVLLLGGWVVGLAFSLLWLALTGLIIGALGRLVLPRRQELSLLATALVGIAAGLRGGFLANAFDAVWLSQC